MRRLTPVLLLVILVWTATACGIGPQEHPERVDIATSPITRTEPNLEGGWRALQVYFIRAGHLRPADRAAEDVAPQTALDLLVAGPTRIEVITGSRTALAPQSLTAVSFVGDTVTIAVMNEFTSVSGENQLLAVAQLVWTVTGLPGIDRMSLTTDGRAVEVATDEGLTSRPVGRSDYLSVAPPSPRTSAPAPTSVSGEPPPEGATPTPTSPQSQGAPPATEPTTPTTPTTTR